MLAYKVTNETHRRPDHRGRTGPRPVGLGDGRMLAPEQSLVLKELPGGVADIATPPDAPLGALSVQDVDLDTGEPIGAGPIPAEEEPETTVPEEEPAAVEEAAEEAGPTEEESAAEEAPAPESESSGEEKVPSAGGRRRSRRRRS